MKRKARGAGQECGDTGHEQTGPSFPKARKAGTARRDVFVNKTLLYERIFEHLDKAEDATVWVDRWAKDLQKESVNLDPDAKKLLRNLINDASADLPQSRASRRSSKPTPPQETHMA